MPYPGVERAPDRCGSRGLLDEAPLAINQDVRLAMEWMNALVGRRSRPFHLPVCLRLRGHVDARALEWAINTLIQRHASLQSEFSDLAALDATAHRTLFRRLSLADFWREPLFHRAIRKSATVALASKRLGSMRHDVRDRAVREALLAEIERSFVCSRAPLLRATLFESSGGSKALLLVFHHLVVDGFSLVLLVRELLATLAHAVGHGPLPPETPGLDYSAFAVSQRTQLAASAMAARITELQRDFGEALACQPRCANRVRLRRSDADTALEAVRCRKWASAHLKRFCRHRGVSVFSLFLAALYLVCARRSAQRRVALGSLWANRQSLEFRTLVGWLAERRLTALDVDAELTAEQWLEVVHATTLAIAEEQHIPAGVIEAQEWGSRRGPDDALRVSLDVAYRFLPDRLPVVPGLWVSPLRLPFTSTERAAKVYVSATSDIQLDCLFDSGVVSKLDVRDLLVTLLCTVVELTVDPQRRVAAMRVDGTMADILVARGSVAEEP